MTRAFNLEFHGYWNPAYLPHLLPASAVYCIYSSTFDERTNMRMPDKLLYVGTSTRVKTSISAWIAYQTLTGSIEKKHDLLVSMCSVPAETADDVQRALVSEHQPPLNPAVLHPLQASLVFTSGSSHGLQGSFFLSAQKPKMQPVGLPNQLSGRPTQSPMAS